MPVRDERGVFERLSLEAFQAGLSWATILRKRGIPTDVAPSAAKFGKQIKFADKRGIPFVWFPGSEGEADTVKDIRSGEQVQADIYNWQPPAEDLHPSVIPTQDSND